MLQEPVNPPIEVPLTIKSSCWVSNATGATTAVIYQGIIKNETDPSIPYVLFNDKLINLWYDLCSNNINK